MKKILILLLILSLLLCGCGKEETPEPAPEQTGETPTQNEEAAPETALETAAAETVSEETETVDDGPEGIVDENDTDPIYRLTRKTALNEDGAELWHMEYDYDETGFVKEVREISAAGQLLRQEVNTPGENGLCEKTEVYEYGALSQTVVNTYDGEGRLVSRRTETADGEVCEETWTYDEKGNELSFQSGIAGVEELLNDWSYVYSYREDGTVATREEYFAGELTGKMENHYDESGRISESVYYGADGSLSYSTVTTWEGSTETITEFNAEDVAYMVTVTTYDAEGNLIRQEVQQDGTVISCVECSYEPFEVPAA